MNKKVVLLIATCLLSVAITFYAISNGIFYYIYYRVCIIAISDSEQGWSKERAIIGKMAIIPGPCAEFAGDYAIRMIRRNQFSEGDRISVLSYKAALIGKDWELIKKKIKKEPQDVNGFDYVLGDSGTYKLSFLIDRMSKIKDIKIEERSQ